MLAYNIFSFMDKVGTFLSFYISIPFVGFSVRQTRMRLFESANSTFLIAMFLGFRDWDEILLRCVREMIVCGVIVERFRHVVLKFYFKDKFSKIVILEPMEKEKFRML